ncbi:MAG TPA: hypothetical protein VMV62_02300 [Candidatus Paceibacterota bacterium]|nr:hypothetical protein [Candidatus Paceibacterota bacterium]
MDDEDEKELAGDLEEKDLVMGDEDEEDEEEDPLTMGFHEEGFEPESDF